MQKYILSGWEDFTSQIDEVNHCCKGEISDRTWSLWPVLVPAATLGTCRSQLSPLECGLAKGLARNICPPFTWELGKNENFPSLRVGPMNLHFSLASL